MKISLLKRLIETNKVPDTVLFFVVNKNKNKKFLAEQYIKTIVTKANSSLSYVDSIEAIDSWSLFDTVETKAVDNHRLFYTDNFIVDSTDIFKEDRLFVITDNLTVDEKIGTTFEEMVDRQRIDVPTIEEWQAIDYMASRAPGLDIETIRWLYSLYDGDMYRIDPELDKICLFSETEQRHILMEFKQEGIFETIPKETVFDISNALPVKDAYKIGSIYKYKDILIKSNDEGRDGRMGFVSLLSKTFKNLILVKTCSNPTPDSTGLTDKQIYAIKRNPVSFSEKQLIEIFSMISDMDRKIKSGELDVALAVDYLILKILTK